MTKWLNIAGYVYNHRWGYILLLNAKERSPIAKGTYTWLKEHNMIATVYHPTNPNVYKVWISAEGIDHLIGMQDWDAIEGGFGDTWRAYACFDHGQYTWSRRDIYLRHSVEGVEFTDDGIIAINE